MCCREVGERVKVSVGTLYDHRRGVFGILLSLFCSHSKMASLLRQVRPNNELCRFHGTECGTPSTHLYPTMIDIDRNMCIPLYWTIWVKPQFIIFSGEIKRCYYSAINCSLISNLK